MTATTGSGKYDALLERCKGLSPVATAVAHPCEQSALAGAVEAGALGLITPILVGPAAKIREIAQQGGIDLTRRRASWTCRTATPRPRRPWNWCAPARPKS